MTDLTATDHTERDNFIKAICQAGYLTPKMAAFAWDNNWDQAKIWQARAALDDGAVSQDVELATLRRQLAENVEAMQQAADTYAFELSTRNTTIDSLRRQLAERETEVERLKEERGNVTRIINASINIGSWLSAALEDDNVCEEMKDDIREWFEATDTDIPAPDEWRCFHCDMRFTDREEAQKHFGEFSAIDPACVEFFKENGAINVVGKCVEQGKQLLELRRQLAEREAEVERLRTDNAQAWKMANKYREQGA